MIEVADGAVWAVHVPFDVIEADSGLTELAQQLLREEDCPPTRTRIAERLSFNLGFRVAILNPSLDAAAESIWKVRELAVAEVLDQNPSATARAKDAGLMATEYEAEIRKCLAEHLTRFADQLDHEALSLAMPAGAFSSPCYNFLVRAATQDQIRYRCQFARTFPIFLAWIAGEREVPTGHVRKIREAIDQGLPLVRFMAELFQVPQNVVRYLVDKDAASVGDYWLARIPALLRVLASIAPEKRPKDAAEWDTFRKACEMLSQFLGRPITTPLSRSWLASAAKRGFIGLTDFGEEAEIPAVVAVIDEFTEALEVALAWEVGRRAPATRLDANAIRRPVDMYVAAQSPVVSYRRALRWRAAYNEARAQGESPKPRENSWTAVLTLPLAIGDLSVVELDCQEALADESKRLNHCVDSYEVLCRSGDCHIFSVRDANGNSLSTAEVRLVRHRNGGMYCALVQHRGLSDGKPEGRCAYAMSVLLRTLKDEPNASRMMALYLTRRRPGIGTGGLPTDIEHLFAVVESVRRTLKGNGKYDRLVDDALRCGGYPC